MVTLRNFAEDDITILQEYFGQSYEQIQNLIEHWKNKRYSGRYFEMLAVVHNGEIAGSVSLYQQSEYSIECGAEIWENFRRNGYGYEAVKYALEIAKAKGFKIAQAQILTDNLASIAIHKKLGFASDGYIYTNAKGRPCYIYLKPLI